MAAAAFLRSVARKIARAPPAPYPRPFLARGLHGGVRSASGPGGSLPPPPTGLAGLGSLASKMASAPPAPHQRFLLHMRGLHSRASPSSASTPPPTGKKDLRARLAEFKIGLSYIAHFCAFIYLYSRFSPENKERRAKLDREMSEIIDAFQAIRHEYQNMNDQIQKILALDRSMQHSGHGEETDGATDKRTRVHNLEEEVAKLHRVKELEDVINHLQSENTELKVALESTRSEGKL